MELLIMNMRLSCKAFKMFLLITMVFVGLRYESRTVEASGFAVYTHGAKELGLANAVVAHSEGPASNFYNAALLTGIEGNPIEAGTVGIAPTREFTSASTGKTIQSESQVYFPSTVFGAYHLDDRYTIGIGVNSPFGLGTGWPEDWEGRYIITDIELKTFLINPNLAVKLTDRLSLAVGVDLLLGDAAIEKHLLPAAPGLSDGNQKFSGDGYGWGMNLGVSYQPADTLSFGVSFRSGVDLDLDGSAEVKVPVGPTTVFSELGGSAELHLPAQLFAGLAWQAADRFLIEGGIRWEQWSRYDTIVFDFENGTRKTETKNWKDSTGFMLGVKYSLNPETAVSAGYLFDDDPVPDDTYDPQVTASQKHAFSLGFQRRWGNFTAAAGYLLELYKDREKNNSVGAASGQTANGTYEQYSHMAGISASWRF